MFLYGKKSKLTFRLYLVFSERNPISANLIILLGGYFLVYKEKRQKQRQICDSPLSEEGRISSYFSPDIIPSQVLTTRWNLTLHLRRKRVALIRGTSRTHLRCTTNLIQNITKLHRLNKFVFIGTTLPRKIFVIFCILIGIPKRLPTRFGSMRQVSTFWFSVKFRRFLLSIQ